MSLTNRQIEAYSRQIILRDFSAASQERLLAASIEIHGHGIAGQTAASYLAGAGIGRLYVDPQMKHSGPFAALEHRSEDTLLEFAPPASRPAILIQTTRTTARTDVPQGVQGVIRIEQNAAGETLLLEFPAATFHKACPLCHPHQESAARDDPAAEAIAGDLAALVALRWLILPAHNEVASCQRLGPGDSTFTRDPLLPESPCSCPARP